MSEGFNRFDILLVKLEQILAALPTMPDGALAFYKSPARQYLFYLEALTHIYKEIRHKKRFERMRVVFKSLEDQLGKVDYYDGFIKDFSVQENFPPVILEYFSHHFTEEINKLEVALRQEGWINPEQSIVSMIRPELEDAEWLSGVEERNAIGEIFIHTIERIKSDYHTGKLNFDDIENGVHEFRRQVRWISIYAQALNGFVQLKQVAVPDPALTSYLTKEVLESPFNVLPALKEGVEPIYIEGPHFYALSWLITESGRLKDGGLRIIVLEEAMRATNYAGEKEVKLLARSLAVKSTKSLKEIKLAMKEMADQFIHHDKILDRIVNDIKRSIGQ